MKILLHMNMPSGGNDGTHQVILNMQDISSLDALMDYITENQGILFGEHLGPLDPPRNHLLELVVADGTLSMPRKPSQLWIGIPSTQGAHRLLVEGAQRDPLADDDDRVPPDRRVA